MSRSSLPQQPDGVAHPAAAATPSPVAPVPAAPGREREPVNGWE
ncbi:hypothetical protein AB0I52_13835 [Streptomyces sp. NPDC050423]